MSKLAHSCEATMEIIERMAEEREARGERDEPMDNAIRNRPFRDAPQNPATIPELVKDLHEQIERTEAAGDTVLAQCRAIINYLEGRP